MKEKSTTNIKDNKTRVINLITPSRTQDKDDDYISLKDFCNDLRQVCDKHGVLREIFDSYIYDFLMDMKGYGLLHRNEDRK